MSPINKVLSLAALLLATLTTVGFTAKPYPSDMRRAFIESCVGFAKELVAPCQCILQNVEKTIPLNTFEALLSSGKADNDPRVITIARKCTNK